MSHTTPARRTASALGACALAALVLAAPAAARPDSGVWERTNGSGGSVGFGAAGSGTAPASPASPVIVAIDDDAVEVLQVGAGFLAGLALAGAGAAMVARRHHRDPSPA